MNLFKFLHSSVKCPYCQNKLEKTPRNKSKCPHCKSIIFVKTKNLYTEAQFKEVQKEEKRQKILKADENWKRLHRDAEEAMKKSDFQSLSGIYFEIALQKHKEGGLSFITQQQARKMELMGDEKNGVAKVKILADVGCDECKKFDGSVFNIEDALKEMPLPVKKCIYKINEEAPDGWCRCSYLPQID